LSGTLEQPVVLPTATGSSGTVLVVGIGDVNGDGMPDIIALAPSNIFLFLNLGDRQFTLNTYPGPIAVFSMAMGDLNGDGKADLVYVDLASRAIGIMYGN
jgi:hypothetical protein